MKGVTVRYVRMFSMQKKLSRNRLDMGAVKWQVTSAVQNML
jgi:hypothetical protein